jgi:phosphoglycolate phosphatase
LTLSASSLILFDIDGTLLRGAGPHHKRALEEAVYEATKVRVSLSDVPTQGALDYDLLRLLLQQAGYAESGMRDLLPDLMERAQDIYLSDSPDDLRPFVCPGVQPLLSSLFNRSIPTGLVTGNLSAIGRRKIELAGLASYFILGAFAEQASTRSELVAVAIADALDRQLIGPNAQISLIGDHPNDVRAAKANRIRAVATATGIATFEELRTEEPDLLVRDLSELSVEALL